MFTFELQWKVRDLGHSKMIAKSDSFGHQITSRPVSAEIQAISIDIFYFQLLAFRAELEQSLISPEFQ